MYLTFFFFNDTATTEIYTLSLHDALPISMSSQTMDDLKKMPAWFKMATMPAKVPPASERIQTLVSLAEKARRSEEHTSELQSRQYLVCRLLLEKKKRNHDKPVTQTPS